MCKEKPNASNAERRTKKQTDGEKGQNMQLTSNTAARKIPATRSRRGKQRAQNIKVKKVSKGIKRSKSRWTGGTIRG